MKVHIDRNDIINDNDIIEALKCCATGTYEECKICSLYHKPFCRGDLTRCTLDFINRLKTEIKEKDEMLMQQSEIIKRVMKRAEEEREIIENMGVLLDSMRENEYD